MEDNKKSPFSPIYYLHDGIDTIVDEKGDQFIALRKVQWAKDSTTEKDPSKAKLELRRWRVTPEGEVPLKGAVFLTENGPHETVLGLLKNGYGYTKDVLLELKTRDDFNDTVKHIWDQTDDATDTDGEYFDIRSMLLGSDDNE